MVRKIFEEVVQAPAVGLEKGIEGVEYLGKALINKKPFKRAEEYWNTLGPGLTTGASDDDPSGIATYSQAGAQFGSQLLWTALWSFPLMATVQEMCARIGLVTGEGLAANIRKHYSPWVLYGSTFLLFMANTVNIGADLGMMAKASQLLIPSASFGFLIVFFAGVSLALQIFTTYARYAKYLKYLALFLITYILTGFVVGLDWHAVASASILPSFTFSWEQLYIVCGILGTTISPYLFFWQTSQEVEEEILSGKTRIAQRRGTTPQEIKKMRTDVWSGMFFSNLVMFFIIAVCWATLWKHGITTISSAQDAALALRPLAGEAAYFLFTFGIIGTGLLAIPVLAGSASYALSESFGWKFGLYRKLKQAYAFYGVIIISIFAGLLLNFTSIDPIRALIYSAVLNGLVSPIILILIVSLSSNRHVMGEWVNGRWTRALGWVTVGIMSVVAVAVVGSVLL